MRGKINISGFSELQAFISCRGLLIVRFVDIGRYSLNFVRRGVQGIFFLLESGGVFGEGVVFVGILVALVWFFWFGGVVFRGVVIFVLVLFVFCKQKYRRVVFTIGKGDCYLEFMLVLFNYFDLNEVTIGVIFCLLDVANVFLVIKVCWVYDLQFYLIVKFFDYYFFLGELFIGVISMSCVIVFN